MIELIIITQHVKDHPNLRKTYSMLQLNVSSLGFDPSVSIEFTLCWSNHVCKGSISCLDFNDLRDQHMGKRCR